MTDCKRPQNVVGWACPYRPQVTRAYHHARDACLPKARPYGEIIKADRCPDSFDPIPPVRLTDGSVHGRAVHIRGRSVFIHAADIMSGFPCIL